MGSTTETLSSANDILAAHSSLLARVRQSQQSYRRKLQSIQPPPLELIRLPLIPSPLPSPSSPTVIPQQNNPAVTPRFELPPPKRARVARYKNYVPEEETIRNDYSQRYVDGGEWPQDWVLGAEPEHRFEEYPKQQRLLNLKKTSVNNYSLPPSYLSFTELNTLVPSKFDVILLDPPFSSSFTWDHLQELPIPSLAADPSFVFLWVGSGAGGGLERGREVLARWGYRRCEDVVWVKTNNTSNKGPGTDPPTTSLLTRTKQHCLIGIRGTVRRSTDSWFVHCNVDTDVIIWEGDPSDPTRKPPEMYTLIENFCLGIRRLEIFGRASCLRRGWITALSQVEEDQLHRTHASTPSGAILIEGDEGGEATRWERESWDTRVKELVNGGKPVVPMTADIDALRPKSPFRPGAASNTSGGNTGGGASGGVVMGVPNNSAMGPRLNNINRGAVGGGSFNSHGLPNQHMIAPQPVMHAHALGMEMGGMNMEGMMGGGWPGMMNGMPMGNIPGMGGFGMNMGANGNMGDMGMMFNPAMGWGEQFGMEDMMNMNMNGGMGQQWGQ